MSNRKNGERKNGLREVDLDRLFALDNTTIDRALRAGVVDAILEHKRLGLPIVVWSRKERRAVWIPADEIPDPRARRKRRRS